ncbi:MAG: flagellar basal-body rod protein FlgF [Parvibaculum sp.]|uniref:flagellar basal-body rod protein FlgF n=1 Tax=Parvibaculum sp. TaxID=2024848 RepID=UPI00284049CE|nr:flagellar basal-body rod protein FlgF [Parvibaculum sp.]MDR3500573.1 flagellar basal-body rod protein FlgF [Parvibaculum sp.]
MDNALLIGLSRQTAMMRQMAVIANNLTNMNTTAYKSESMLFDEYVMPNASEQSPDKKLSFVQDYGQMRDLADGEMKTTGNPLDIAIAGSGMFKVQTPTGTRYTRNGHLQLDATGQLVTSNGYPVMTTAGTNVTFAADDGQITIASDGTITTDKGQRGKIALVDFANMQDLQNDGENLTTTTQAEQPVANPRMIQGSIEGSNVKPIIEMTNMIAVSRSYESTQSLIEAADNMRRQAISQIGGAV